MQRTHPGKGSVLVYQACVTGCQNILLSCGRASRACPCRELIQAQRTPHCGRRLDLDGRCLRHPSQMRIRWNSRARSRSCPGSAFACRYPGCDRAPAPAAEAGSPSGSRARKPGTVNRASRGKARGNGSLVVRAPRFVPRRTDIETNSLIEWRSQRDSNPRTSLESA